MRRSHPTDGWRGVRPPLPGKVPPVIAQSTDAARAVQRTYLLLTLLSTLAASLTWGVNTIFLLDAGLSNTQAFAANAFCTAGMMIFEVPTGVVADAWGRRASYLLGAATLLVSDLAVPLDVADRSTVLGLGAFLRPNRPRLSTFFSGAAHPSSGASTPSSCSTPGSATRRRSPPTPSSRPA